MRYGITNHEEAVMANEYIQANDSGPVVFRAEFWYQVDPDAEPFDPATEDGFVYVTLGNPFDSDQPVVFGTPDEIEIWANKVLVQLHAHEEA